MKTFPIYFNKNKSKVIAFEIENLYISNKKIVRLLKSLNGVSLVKLGKGFLSNSDVRAEFSYLGEQYIVYEPFGDNSRYWIGPKETDEKAIDIKAIEDKFETYSPGLFRKLLGDIFSFKFLLKPNK